MVVVKVEKIGDDVMQFQPPNVGVTENVKNERYENIIYYSQ